MLRELPILIGAVIALATLLMGHPGPKLRLTTVVFAPVFGLSGRSGLSGAWLRELGDALVDQRERACLQLGRDS